MEKPDALRLRPDEAGLPRGVQRAGSRGQPPLPAPGLHDGDMVSTWRTATTSGRSPRTPFAATLNKTLGAHALQGRHGDADLRRATASPPATPRAASTRSPTPTPRQNSASGTDYQGLQSLRRVPPRACPPRRRSRGAADYDEYSTTWGFFVQDDWRVNNKLTLNLGLRYEVETRAGREATTGASPASTTPTSSRSRRRSRRSTRRSTIPR